MPFYPLQFTSVNDVCLFIKAVTLRKFLLLGKQTILIARLSDEQLSLALQTYGASLVEKPEIHEIIHQYSQQENYFRPVLT